MKKAMFYEKKGDDKVLCTLCPNDCTIKQDGIGFCGVRQNIKGELYSLVYGKLSAMNVDPIEKKPLYHFHPGSYVMSVGTLGCNMRCKHCQNWQIAHTDGITSANLTQEMSAKGLVKSAKENNSPGIAFTYNEPSIWFEYALETMKLAKEEGLYTVFVTAGWIHEEPLNMLIPYLDAYSLDIKGFSDRFYREIVKKNTFKPVLDAAVNTKSKGVHLEIVTNIIPDYNDDDDQLNDLTRWIASNLGDDTPIHFTAFHPSFQMKDKQRTPLRTLNRAFSIAKDNGLMYVYLGNVLTDNGSNTYCPECGEVLIIRPGFGRVDNRLQDGKCPNCSHKVTSYVGD
jgi:pyruvate formate lyase activating enzyme